MTVLLLDREMKCHNYNGEKRDRENYFVSYTETELLLTWRWDHFSHW